MAYFLDSSGVNLIHTTLLPGGGMTVVGRSLARLSVYLVKILNTS